MLYIVRSLRNVNSYHDATGRGFTIRPNAKYDSWKGNALTPAQPQPIGAWIARWLDGSHVCKVFHSQGAFSVPSWQVRQRTKHFYQTLLRQVELCAQCEVCHYLERLWHAVFKSPRNGAFQSARCIDNTTISGSQHIAQ